MILYGMVISDMAGRSFKRASGEEVIPQILTIVDQDKSGYRLVQSVDVQLESSEDKARYAGKLLDKRIEVAVHNITIFQGRPRFEGKITMVDGKPEAVK